MSGKVRKTLTLDPDSVDVLGDDTSALSATVNSVLRAEMGRRARREGLAALVAELEEQYGEADPAEVERFRQMLG